MACRLDDPDDDVAIKLVESLTLQLSEMEMLMSMYPNAGELTYDDPIAEAHVQAFIDGELQYEYLIARIGFILKITIQKICIEMVCRFPHEYPQVEPVVFLRAPKLSRTALRRLSDDLQIFVQSLDRGELYMCSVIQWLQENSGSAKYIEAKTSVAAQNADNKPVMFTRLWIYSHHIYSKIKRKDILEFCAELRLSGFSMPGKPGLIVVEGYADDVDEFWHRIRAMQWKRLCMKEKTDIPCAGHVDVESNRTFCSFSEMTFEPRGGKGREYHMDLGLLYQFLEKHNFPHIFELYFGVEGKVKLQK